MHFSGFYRPDRDQERIVYVSDLDTKTVSRLASLLSDPPYAVILGGDAVFAPKYNRLKYLLYEVMKPAQRELGFGTKHSPDMTDQELCNYESGHPEPISMRRRFLELQKYICKLLKQEFKSNEYTDEAVAKAIRAMADGDNVYYGPWLWPQQELCQAAVDDFKHQSEITLEVFRRLIGDGITVNICGGNDDNVAKTHAGYIKRGGQVYDPIPSFIDAGVNYIHEFGAIETDRAIHVIAPYWGLRNNEYEAIIRRDKAVEAAANGHQASKSVILVCHCDPIWSMHNLTTDNPWQVPRDDRYNVTKNLHHLIAQLQREAGLDEIIYSGKEGPILDHDKRVVGCNEKFVIEVSGGEVHLVMNNSEFHRAAQIPVTYLSVGSFAINHIPRSGICRTNFHVKNGRQLAFVY